MGVYLCLRLRNGATAHTTSFSSYGPQATIRRRFALTDWAKKLETQQAWKELAQKHDLLDKELRDVDRIFAFADAALANAVQVAFRWAPRSFSRFHFAC